MLSSGYFPDSFSFCTSTHVPNAKSHGSEDNHTGECKDVQHRKVFQPSPEDLDFCHRLIPSLLLAVKNIPKHSWWSHIAQYKDNYIRVHLPFIFQLQNIQKHRWQVLNPFKLPGNKDLALPHQFFQWTRNFYRTHASVAASLVWFRKSFPLQSSSWVASSVALPDGAEDEVFPPTEWGWHLLWVKYVKHKRYGSINIQ